jgi:Right handed beta helix region
MADQHPNPVSESARTQLVRRLAGVVLLLVAVSALVVVPSLGARTAGAKARGAATGPLAQIARRARCSHVASTHGSDRHSGTRRHPFRTVQRLINSLRPGQRGCLLGGVFHGYVRFNHGGRPGAAILLSSWPGRHSTIAGRIYIPHGSDYIGIVGLHLVGSNRAALPSPTVDGAHVAFAFDDVTTRHRGICFDLGSLQFGEAIDIAIVTSRIHGCGRFPATNHEHGIYDEYSRGVLIARNRIYNNADRGINLYPLAVGTRIIRNVIDDNGDGVLFAGDGGHASWGNVVAGNVITRSRISNVASSWVGPIGRGNVVTGNCIWGAGHHLVDAGSGGFRAYSNYYDRPRFVSRHPVRTGNFRLRRGSRCARLHAG